MHEDELTLEFLSKTEEKVLFLDIQSPDHSPSITTFLTQTLLHKSILNFYILISPIPLPPTTLNPISSNPFISQIIPKQSFQFHKSNDITTNLVTETGILAFEYDLGHSRADNVVVTQDGIVKGECVAMNRCILADNFFK